MQNLYLKIYYLARIQGSLEHPIALSNVIFSEGTFDDLNILKAKSHSSTLPCLIPAQYTGNLTSGAILKNKYIACIKYEFKVEY